MRSTSILIVFAILLSGLNKAFSQTVKNYETDWKKVDELIQKKNLPQSALAEVKKIYAKAKADKQDAQIIKSLVYMIGLQQENREDNDQKAINDIEKEITVNKEPAASILKSLLADTYWRYFQQHRYQLYDRTNTVNFNKNDIATWTIEDFHKKISNLYLQSLSNAQLLKQTRLEPFDAIITKGNMRNPRPTLYDLLAHHALEYFRNNERDINKPAYAFEINQLDAFAPAEEFTAYKFTTRDSLSLQQKALLIYQDLIAFHLKDEKPDALIDVDIERIQFVHDNAVMDNKDELYRKALENITSRYGNNSVAAQTWYLLASYYNDLASDYDPLKDSTHRFDRIKAKEILEKVVNDSAIKSEGWTNSYNLLQEIQKRSFSFQLEKVNIPDQPFRALVKYNNINALNFRLIKADEALMKLAENYYNDQFWNALIKANVLKSWQQNLPETNDLQNHSVEVKVDGLPVGEYYLLASPDQQFNKKNSSLGAQLFYVSNISYVNEDNKFFVLNRETGQPLVNAAIQFYQQQYDYKTSKYIRGKLGSYKTDDKGYFTIQNKREYRYNSFFLDINYQNDHLFLNDPVNTYYYNSDNSNTPELATRVFFFTDRSIYRPGQTVYFKGIIVNKLGNEQKIAVNQRATVYLQNANGEQIDSLILISSEFGSVSGKFNLPQNVLNGEFSIHANLVNDYRSSAQFSVEEYKRPKFYVDFEKIKKSYKVNDTVVVTGTAKAYAGNNIDGAKVIYRVVRQPRFIYTWLTWKWWLPPSAPMEIAHGETTTDKDGKFSIQFSAIPDRKIDEKLDPVFDYEVYADVTDLNGETRSNSDRITAGYKSLLLKVNVADRLPVDSFKTINIRTENMNGEYQPSAVTVSFSRLIPENRLVRNRYWQQPDQYVMSKEEFISYFPHDEYKNELNYKTWPVGEKVFIKTDSTKANGEWSLSNQLSNGYYVIEVTTKDKDGKEVKNVQYTELFDSKTNQFNKPEYLWAKGSTPVEPGEKTNIQIGSSTNAFVVNQTNKQNDKENNFDFIQLNNQKKIINYTPTEADRGGYGVNFFFVKDNRFYQFSDIIKVPWTNKELNIEYASFRDKTLPGSEERWKVKITGYKNDKVAAELLASMYDASLDQFREHKWEKPDVWPTYNNSISWNSNNNFQGVESNVKVVELPYKNFSKIYDELNFGQPFRLYPFRKEYLQTNANPNARLEEVTVTAAGQKIEMVKGTPPIIKKDFSEGVTLTMATDTTNLINPYSNEEENKNSNSPSSPIQIRKNFNETAFFFPDLYTDENGTIEFSFTTPEALTKWKLQTLAHTKDLAFGYGQKELITQKQLMVQPNAPRFLRQGDHLEFTAKIVNLSDSEVTGQAQLLMIDPTTNQSVDGWFMNTFPNQYFTVAAGQSEVVKFPIQVPFQYNKALTWRVVASSGNLSDGEENTLPVLTNKVLVTETMPLAIRGTGTKNFTFDKLLQSGNSETLLNQALTVEYTSNPAWYAVQALPYLMEYPYECAEQTWNRYYANALASKIANSSPRIKQIFERWKTADTAALLSNLQKNEELKSVLLEETPWVLQANSEEQQKKNIALLFDMVRMSNDLKSNLEKLKQMQSPNGGFVWFKGGPDDRYITQYIVTGIGHLKKLGANSSDLNSILSTAIPYLDQKIKEDYNNLVKSKADLKKQQISYYQIQYLYMRSFLPEYPVPQASLTAYNYFRKQAQSFWMKQNKYMEGMIALSLNRTGDKQTPSAILKSLKETALTSEEMGMYWKDNSFGRSWYWWYAPIETQSLLIEAFSEAGNDTRTVDDLKTWLVKNKQTNNWSTSKATADACYALLLQGSDWLKAEPLVQIHLGDKTIYNTNQKTEAGTGYFKQTIEGQFVQPEMGKISVTVQNSNEAGENKEAAPSWGAVYWQYFEDMDKVTTASTPLQLAKKLFIEKLTDRGPVLTPVEEGTELHVGDKIKVRIELRVDRDMEYVHMKDMRASALEPVNVLSSYKWQGGLGYYESTKDASTNFFFNYLRKGTYVFEYPLFVTHTGDFSNGITSIQCMYAPEFSAHSEGVRVVVEE